MPLFFFIILLLTGTLGTVIFFSLQTVGVLLLVVVVMCLLGFVLGPPVGWFQGMRERRALHQAMSECISYRKRNGYDALGLEHERANIECAADEAAYQQLRQQLGYLPSDTRIQTQSDLPVTSEPRRDDYTTRDKQ